MPKIIEVVRNTLSLIYHLEATPTELSQYLLVSTNTSGEQDADKALVIFSVATELGVMLVHCVRELSSHKAHCMHFYLSNSHNLTCTHHFIIIFT